jgi:hypothetical protein
VTRKLVNVVVLRSVISWVGFHKRPPDSTFHGANTTILPLAVLYNSDENHRTVALIQVHRRGVHTVVETIQDESSSGEGALETPGAGTAVGCGGCNSGQKVIQSGRGILKVAMFSEPQFANPLPLRARTLLCR